MTKGGSLLKLHRYQWEERGDRRVITELSEQNTVAEREDSPKDVRSSPESHWGMQGRIQKNPLKGNLEYS